MNTLPETGYLRIKHIVGQTEVTPEQAEANRLRGKGLKRPRPAINPLIPVCAKTWWNGVRDGRYPKPLKLGSNITAWRAEDIRELIEKTGAEQ